MDGEVILRKPSQEKSEFVSFAVYYRDTHSVSIKLSLISFLHNFVYYPVYK